MTTIEEEMRARLDQFSDHKNLIVSREQMEALLGDRCRQATPKPPAWVVTWTWVCPDRVVDGTSTLTSWQAALDYIQRIVPPDATFTVKPA